MKKKAIITVRLIPTPEAYEGKTNRDIEREVLVTSRGIIASLKSEKLELQRR